MVEILQPEWAIPHPQGISPTILIFPPVETGQAFVRLAPMRLVSLCLPNQLSNFTQFLQHSCIHNIIHIDPPQKCKRIPPSKTTLPNKKLVTGNEDHNRTYVISYNNVPVLPSFGNRHPAGTGVSSSFFAIRRISILNNLLKRIKKRVGVVINLEISYLFFLLERGIMIDFVVFARHRICSFHE